MLAGAASSSLLYKRPCWISYTPTLLHATAGTTHDPQVRAKQYDQEHGQGQGELYVLRPYGRRTDQGYDDDAAQQGKGYHACNYHSPHHKRAKYSSV